MRHQYNKIFCKNSGSFISKFYAKITVTDTIVSTSSHLVISENQAIRVNLILCYLQYVFHCEPSNRKRKL